MPLRVQVSQAEAREMYPCSGGKHFKTHQRR